MPEIVITLRPTASGGLGGASRKTNGSGVDGLGGCWRMTRGGAGAIIELGSWVITISPGIGGVGGLKYLIASSWIYSKFFNAFLVIILGLVSSLSEYSQIGISPFQLTTSSLFAHMPWLPRADTSSEWFNCIGTVDLRIASSIWLKKVPVSKYNGCVSKCEPWLDVKLEPVDELFDDLDDLNDIVLIDEPNREDLVEDPLMDDDFEDVDFLECGDDLPDVFLLKDFLEELDFEWEEDLPDNDDDLSDEDEANLPDLLDFSDGVVEPGIDVDLLFEVGRMNDSFKCCFIEFWDVCLIASMLIVCACVLYNDLYSKKNVTKVWENNVLKFCLNF